MHSGTPSDLPSIPAAVAFPSPATSSIRLPDTPEDPFLVKERPSIPVPSQTQRKLRVTPFFTDNIAFELMGEVMPASSPLPAFITYTSPAERRATAERLVQGRIDGMLQRIPTHSTLAQFTQTGNVGLDLKYDFNEYAASYLQEAQMELSMSHRLPLVPLREEAVDALGQYIMQVIGMPCTLEAFQTAGIAFMVSLCAPQPVGHPLTPFRQINYLAFDRRSTSIPRCLTRQICSIHRLFPNPLWLFHICHPTQRALWNPYFGDAGEFRDADRSYWLLNIDLVHCPNLVMVRLWQDSAINNATEQWAEVHEDSNIPIQRVGPEEHIRWVIVKAWQTFLALAPEEDDEAEDDLDPKEAYNHDSFYAILAALLAFAFGNHRSFQEYWGFTHADRASRRPPLVVPLLTPRPTVPGIKHHAVRMDNLQILSTTGETPRFFCQPPQEDDDDAIVSAAEDEPNVEDDNQILTYRTVPGIQKRPRSPNHSPQSGIPNKRRHPGSDM